MHRVFWALVLGAALGLAACAEPTTVKLTPAAVEVQALREAWDQVLKVFEEFVIEIKGAVDTLNKNDQDLLAKYRVVAVQLKDLEAKILQIQESFVQKTTALEQSLANALAQIGALRKSLEEAVSGLRAADAALEAKLQAGLGELRRALDQAIAACLEADAALEARLRTELGEVRRTLDQAIAACKEADAALEAKISVLSGQIEQVSQRVRVLESYDIGNLSRRVLSLEQAIQAVQIKIENNREKIAALEKTLGGFAADIAALKDSVLALEARVSDHEARIASVEESLGMNVQDLSARLDTIQVLAILGLLAGIGALVLVLLGMGG